MNLNPVTESMRPPYLRQRAVSTLTATALVVSALLMGWGCGQNSDPKAPAAATNAVTLKMPPVGMVWIGSGEFSMGGPGADTTVALRSGLGAGEPMCSGLRDGFTDSDPVHRVFVDGFWMD